VKQFLVVAALLVLSFSVGYAVKPDGRVGPGPDRTDTVSAARYQRMVLNLQRERDGLRARLEAVESRGPRIITRTDTVVQPPDTVFLPIISASARGKLTLPALIADTLDGYRPEIWQGFDVSDCDDGWSVQNGVLVCDRPRLGHLSWGLQVGFGMDFLSRTAVADPVIAELGLWWQPTYRSTWDVGTSLGTDGRARLTVRKAWRLW